MADSSAKQRTIKKAVSLSGIALHSGEETEIKFCPASPGQGVVFRRVDLPDAPEIRAEPETVISTRRCTTIGCSYRGEKVYIKTVEHLLAAVWATGIDNLLVELSGPEIPITDGSAHPFLELLSGAGCERQQEVRRVLEPTEAVWVRDDNDETGSCLGLMPYDGFKVSYVLDYDHPRIGTQFLEFDGESDCFGERIARARTFGFSRDIDFLHEKGMALGGSLDNVLVFEEGAPLNEPRFPDEPVRHKVLDLIGDMFLNGFIRGHVIAIKSGHSLNVKLAERIAGKRNGVH